MLKYITYSPNHLFDRLLPSKAKLILHDSRWWPSWKLAAILKYSEHLNCICNINCAICMLKIHSVVKILFFDHLMPFLRQKITFHNTPWRPSWKMAAILKFCVARVFFLKSDPHRVFVPNLLLVSWFERFLQLSAPLHTKCRIYASVNWVSIGSNNGLSSARPEPAPMYYKIHNLSFKKMHLKMSSAKWRSFHSGGRWVNTTAFR